MELVTALDAHHAEGLDHRGVLYTDRASLVALAVPLITRALADGERVVVVVDRATARELDEALAHEVGTSSITFPSPSALGGHGSRAFTECLAGWADGPVRVVALTQYAPGELGPGVDPSLSGLPLTLICACAEGADPAVRRAFDDDHDAAPRRHADPHDGHGPPAAALETDLAGSADLAGVRRQVRRAAVAAGFRGRELDRTVLAVHEACALGCRLLVGAPTSDPAGDTTAETARDTAGDTAGDTDRRCWVTVRTGDGRLSADVVVPGAAGTDGAALPGTPGVDQDTVLGHVGHFCHAVSVHDGRRSRAIRVQARTALAR